MAEPKRILIIRPSALGDVCRSVPVLASLARAFPDAAIDWVVRDSYVDAIRSHPALHEAIAFPRSRLGGWWRNPKTAAETWKWFRGLRHREYDVVVDCQGLGRSGLMTAVTGAAMRIGHADAREFAWLGYNERVRSSMQMHTVDRMLSLLEPLGIEIIRDMRLYVGSGDTQWWQQQSAQRECASSQYVVLAPTARWESKRWPIQRWTELIGPLTDRGFERCVVIGAPGEEPQVESLVADSSAVNLVGDVTIGQTMAVIEQAALVIANDSAPLHMAVGLDVPCVALFGPTNPALVGPYRKQDSVVRRYDDADGAVHFKDRSLGDSLMRLIDVSDVLERVDTVLGER